jgi:hypothetical protein
MEDQGPNVINGKESRRRREGWLENPKPISANKPDEQNLSQDLIPLFREGIFTTSARGA